MGKGLKIERQYTKEGQSVWDTVTWVRRHALIEESDGRVVFSQTDIEVPDFWSQSALNIVASKYFRGHIGEDNRETSVRYLIHRVVDTITTWGNEIGVFDGSNYADLIFYDELCYILLHQHASFNSPVWFNIGVPNTPQQASACFINTVEDNLESIMELAATEAAVFKSGSGSGVNLSKLRASGEPLSRGGKSSGPISFMKGLDTFAGAIKSGGTTRRAAKMVLLDCKHPDIIEFIRCKAIEEKKAHALIDAGYDGNFNVHNGAYDTVGYQNANNSVRVNDVFMWAATSVLDDRSYYTLFNVSDGAPAKRLRAKDVLREIAESTYICGDPGIQFDDTINNWHTCPNTDRIYASNPCSEFVFLDNTACNLASINLLKYRDEKEGYFKIAEFIDTVDILITAQEILVGKADYPTEKIKQMSHDYRPLGLGYCNLGAYLMASGLAYDSDLGRSLAASITSLMTGAAYRHSARLAGVLGPFKGLENNSEAMLNVIKMHTSKSQELGQNFTLICRNANSMWSSAIHIGRENGFRNAQVTVLAPTGTIAFMMDADTTGVEPDIALVKYKKLVGGGMMKLVNGTVREALNRLGYDEGWVNHIIKHIHDTGTIEGEGSVLKEEHLPIFDCAFKPANGTRSISWEGHIKMMGAVQPFLSGAISKTVNMPEDCTVEEIMDAYILSWKEGVKAVAIYRDNSKRTQPLSTSSDISSPENEPEVLAENLIQGITFKVNPNLRRKLPEERNSITHKFRLSDHEGYITVGMYEDGTPGEMFLKMSKEGSMVSGLMDSFAIAVSMGLQYGVPISELIRKFKHTRFEPHGFTGNPEIRQAKSLMDYIFTWMELKFLKNTFTVGDLLDMPDIEEDLLEEERNQPVTESPDPDNLRSPLPVKSLKIFSKEPDLSYAGTLCSQCGSKMQRTGSCQTCPTCGNNSGCG